MNEAYLSESPAHIVVFREIDEKNIDALAKILDVREAPGLCVRASCAVLQPNGAGIHTRVYRNLAVAATTLTEDQQMELQKRDDLVLEIVPNQTRCIPTTVSEHPVGNYIGDDPLNAYLQGMQDAIEAVQRFRSGVERIPLLPFAAQATSFNRSWSWCLDMIGITPGYTTATGKGVKVAVLDTGIDLQHPDFYGRVLENDNTESFVPSETIHDGNGHGTHCAGIIAGPQSSASGKRYGVASEAELLIVKVLDNQGFGIDDKIFDAMSWASECGAKILSMSFVSEKEGRRSINQSHSAAYEQIAKILLENGVLVLAAAGNWSTRPMNKKPVDNPAACPSVKAVAALDCYKQVATFSCAKMDEIGILDISAPGVSVYSAYTGQTFRSLSGTSMATPHVAGIAALYFQVYPDLTASEIWNKILSDAFPLGNREDFGHGLIQAPLLEV